MQGPNQLPTCAVCGKVVSRIISHTAKNPNRWFYKCPDNHRNVFFWEDEYRPVGGGAAALQQQYHHAPQAPYSPAPATPGQAGIAGGSGGGGAGWNSPQAQYGGSQYGSPRYGPGPSQAQPAGTPQQQPYGQQPYTQQQRTTPQQAATNAGAGEVVTVQIMDVGARYVGYSTAKFNEAFKNIMSDELRHTRRIWDPDNKNWKVPGEHRDEATATLRRHGFIVQDPPLWVTQILVSQNSPYNPKIKPEEIQQRIRERADPELWSRLFRFQKEGVTAGVRLGGRVLLADEMGLGKTVQALTLMSLYAEDWPLLIICPTSMRGAWAAAVEDWLPPRLRPAPPDLWLITSGPDWNKKAAEAGLPRGVQDPYERGAARPHVAVVSYELVAKMPQEFLNMYPSVIADECHNLKDRRTKRYRAVEPLVQRAARAVLCTGTPLLNRPIEAWAQVNLLRPSIFMSYDEYGRRYCLNPKVQAWQYRGGGGYGGRGTPYPSQEYTGCQLAAELRAMLTECVMVRRLKRNVLTDLPPKIRTKVMIQPNADDARAVTAAVRQLSDVEAKIKAGQILGPEAKAAHDAAWGAAYCATGPAKVPGATEFILRLLHIGTTVETDEEGAAGEGAAGPDGGAAAGGGGAAAGGSGRGGGGEEDEEGRPDDGEGPAKLLVFCYHHKVLDRLEGELKQNKVPLVRIDGSTPAAQRDKAVRQFQGEPGSLPGNRRPPRVALLSIRAAGVGLTLTAASIVVFVELDQVPATMTQAEDRAHRVGQQAHVHVYYLIGKGTLDDRIWRVLEGKKFATGAVMDGAGAVAEEGQSDEQRPYEPYEPGATGEAEAAAAAAAGPRTAPRTTQRRRRLSWDTFEEDEQAAAAASAAAADGGAQGYGGAYGDAPAYNVYGSAKGVPPPAAAAATAAQPQQVGGVRQRGTTAGGGAAAAGASAGPPAAFDWNDAFDGLLPPLPAAAFATVRSEQQTPPSQQQQQQQERSQEAAGRGSGFCNGSRGAAGGAAGAEQPTPPRGYGGKGSGGGGSAAAAAAATASRGLTPRRLEYEFGDDNNKAVPDDVLDPDFDEDPDPQPRRPAPGASSGHGHGRGAWDADSADAPGSQHSASNRSTGAGTGAGGAAGGTGSVSRSGLAVGMGPHVKQEAGAHGGGHGGGSGGSQGRSGGSGGGGGGGGSRGGSQRSNGAAGSRPTVDLTQSDGGEDDGEGPGERGAAKRRRRDVGGRGGGSGGSGGGRSAAAEPIVID